MWRPGHRHAQPSDSRRSSARCAHAPRSPHVPNSLTSRLTQDECIPVSICSEIFLLCLPATVLTFFIAGLLYLLRFERVDDLGACELLPIGEPGRTASVASCFTSQASFSSGNRFHRMAIRSVRLSSALRQPFPSAGPELRCTFQDVYHPGRDARFAHPRIGFVTFG